MSGWTLVEPCSGSAAFTLHLLGARRALLPYQGSKWRFRHSLEARARSLGFEGAPSRVRLTDPGPWGHTLRVVLDAGLRLDLIRTLERWSEQDPRSVYNGIHLAPVSTHPVTAAAEHLFLQRLAFSGKAVGIRKGSWASPGFNTSSAYGLAGTGRFGPVKPMIPSLIRVLRGYADQLRASATVHVQREPAHPPAAQASRTLVYLDPPYAGTTAYPNGAMDSEEVASLAQAWRCAGAAVMVSEQRGVPLDDWNRQQLYVGRNDTSPFRGKQAEWVTWSGPGHHMQG